MTEDNNSAVERRYGEGFLRLACPGDEQDNPPWILRFADQDCREAVFIGEDAEQRAWEAWNRYAPSYNCYLFRTATLAKSAQPTEAMAQRLQDHMEQHHGVCLKASEWDAAIDALHSIGEA